MRRLLAVLLSLATTVFGQDERPSLDALLALYDGHGLPHPPASARLAMRDLESGGPEKPRGHLMWRLPVPERDLFAFTLSGTGKRTVPASTLRDVEPLPASAEGTSPPGGHVPFDEDRYLALAIQLHKRGLTSVAKVVLDAGRNPQWRPVNTEAVHRLAWAYWLREAAVPGRDRALVAKRLAAVVKTGVVSEFEARVVAGISAAAQPRPDADDDMQQIVEGLLECQGFPTRGRAVADPEGIWWARTITSKLDPRHEAVLRTGLRIVPTLVRHMDDARTTRALSGPVNRKPWQLITVGEIATAILAELAGHPAGGPMRLPSRPQMDKRALRRFAQELQSEDEGAWAERRVLGEGRWPNPVLLEILALRHEKRLASVYRRLLSDREEMYSHPVIEKLHVCSLADEEKLALFEAAARHGEWEHRRAAMFAINKIDRSRLAPHVRYSLERMPRIPDTDYWSSGANPLSQLVVHAHDESTWQLLEEVAKKTSIGMRMELIGGQIVARSLTRPQKDRRLRFLAAFLDDEATRDREKDSSFQGPCAGFKFRVLSVRNLAAMHLGMALGLDERPATSWTEARWVAFRARVDAALRDRR